MFSFQEQGLDRENLLYHCPRGPVYPYSQDSDVNKWAVEVLTTTNEQLISYIEDIILRFTYLHDIVPMEGFYMKPIEEKIGKVNVWEIYIKVPRKNEGLKLANMQIPRRATFEFEADRLMHENRLAKGSFGYVYPYQEGLKNNKWVVKVMSVSNSELPRVIEEILIGFSCEHPNVLSIKGFHMEPVGGSYENVEKWNVYIKMPRMKESLKEKLERHKRSGPNMLVEEGKKYVFQITTGLKYLHERGIAHRDLKPGNILLDYRGNALIADMGQANLTAGESELTANNKAGTKSYRAPELETGEKLAKKSLFKADIWSLGLVMADICFIDTDIEGSGDKKAETLLKRINDRKKKEDSYLDLSLVLLGFDPQRNSRSKTIEQIEAIITNEETMAKLREQADKSGNLELFYQEAKSAKDYFNNRYSHQLLNELKDIHERYYYEDIFSCNPKIRPTIQSLYQIINSQKAADLLMRATKELGLFDCLVGFMDWKGYEDLDDDPENLPPYLVYHAGVLAKLEQGEEMSLDSLKKVLKAEAEKVQERFEKKIKRARQNQERQELTPLTNVLRRKNEGWFSFKGDGLEQSLKIKELRSRRMDNQMIRTLLQSIHTKKAKNLRSLKFSFQRDPEDRMKSGSFANILETDVPDMYPLNLQKISIDLTWQKNLEIEDYKELFRYLGAYHKNITSLHLSFNFCDGFRDNAVRELGLLIETHLNYPKNLELGFRQCANLTDDVAIELLQKIGLKGKGLTSLRLNLKYCQKLSQATNIELANQLENFKNLFQLKLEAYSFGDEASRHLFEKLRKLENLQILKLDLKDLDGLRVADAAVGALATSIGAHLQELQILSLVFNDATQITDKSAQHLINTIGSNLPRLRSFTLKFIRCDKIGDGAVGELQNQIKVKNLLCIHLDLSFEKCFKVSSQAILGLVQQIAAEDEPYRYLGLDFNGCRDLDDSACIQIATLLGQGLRPKNLKLGLSDLDLAPWTQKDIREGLSSIILKHIEFCVDYNNPYYY